MDKNKKRFIYIGILFIVTVIVSITYFSYAFLSKKNEYHGRINVVAGTLNYKIASDDLEDNSITLAANEAKEIEIIVTSLNQIESDYKLYTNIVENVEIGYIDETGYDPAVGTIGASGTKTIRVELINDSDTAKTITFGVQGGLKNKEMVLEDTKVVVELGDSICSVAPGTVYNFAYTGSVQNFTTSCTGSYKIELWGAQGGSACYSNNLNSGAYTSGVVRLQENTNLKVYVGQSTNTQGATAFNGGGIGYASNYSSSYAATGAYSGGGATDIRYGGTSLNDRVMVAAGGGGRGTSGGTLDCNNAMYQGGPGGGLKGYGSRADSTYNSAVYGATQTSGGSCINTSYCGPGSFGQGGSSISNNHANGGGGGGYYGGGADRSAYREGTSGLRGGGGGSSFISGHAGCVAIQSSSSTSIKSGCSTLTDSNKLECSKHYSGLYFVSTKMIDGMGYTWTDVVGTQEQMPKPSGNYYEAGRGNAGSGYARITYLGTKKTVSFNANGGEVSETRRKVNAGYPIGELPTPTKDGKVFLGWYADANYTTRVDSTYSVERSITLYAAWGTEVDMNLAGRTQGYPSSTEGANTTNRTWNTSNYVVGLAGDNYYGPSWVSNYSVGANAVTVASGCGYGVVIPMTLEGNKKYMITPNVLPFYYTSDGTYSGYVQSALSDNEARIFTVPSNAAWVLFNYGGGGQCTSEGIQQSRTYSNIHLYKLD